MSNTIPKSICRANVEALRRRFEEVSKGKTDPELEKVRSLIITPDGEFSAKNAEVVIGLGCLDFTKGTLGEIFGEDSAKKLHKTALKDKLDALGGRGVQSEFGTRERREVQSNVPNYSKIEREKFLTQEKAEKWINEHAGVGLVVRHFYENLLLKHPGTKGKIVFTISVDKTGEPSVKTHTASPALDPHAEDIRAPLERTLKDQMPKFPTQTGFSFRFPCVFVTGQKNNEEQLQRGSRQGGVL